MPHLLNIWPAVIRRLAGFSRVLLLFDYDGTLMPLGVNPEITRLPDKVRLCLRNLAEKERFIVGVVSGRELAELEKLVAIPGLVYVGNHGFEMSGLGMDFVYSDALEFIESVTTVAGLLEQELKSVPELLVCNKRLSLSVHYRNTPDSYAKEVDRTITSVLEPYVSEGELKIIRGKKIVEVMPNINWGKGEAIKKIYRGCGDNPGLMFFGDDRDDEDGFAVVQGANGIAVSIGPPRRDTKALHQLESPAEVAQILELLDNSRF